MFKTPRAVVLALTLLAAAPTVAHADGNARMHWRGLHGTWLGHGGPRSIPAGDGAGWVTFDAATDTLYIANGIANTISVIDAGRCGRHCENPVATLPTGHTPASTFINGRTLYAPNLDDGTLSVYDIATCNAHVISGCGPAVATMPIGGVPLGVTVDAASNSVYVGNAVIDSLAIVDGATCNRAVTSGCTVVGQAATAPGPAFPFIDPATRTLYSPDNGVDTEATGSSVSVIDLRACNAHVLTGCAHPTATVPAGTGPVTGGVDPTTRTVYVTNQADNTVSVIDGARCNGHVTAGCAALPPTTPVAPEPNSGVAIDQASHTLYVVGSAQDVLSAVDTARCRAGDTSGCAQAWPTLQTGDLPFWLDFDQRTRTLYTANFVGDDVSALDAASCSALRTSGCRDLAPVIDSGSEAGELAIDRRYHTMYDAQPNDHLFDLIDIARCSAARPDRCPHRTEPVPVSGPFDVAVDEGTQTIYVTNQDDHDVVLIDPATCNASRSGGCAPVGAVIPIPGRPYELALDPRTHAVYVAGFEGNQLYRIDGAHCRIGDRSRCTPASGPAGTRPLGIALDSATDTVYTANVDDGSVSVVDVSPCCTEKARIKVGGGPQHLAFDAGTRTLYVPSFGDDEPGSVSVIDTRACNARVTSGCGQTPTSMPAGRGALDVTVDPTTHTLYTTDILHGTVSILDGSACNAVRHDGCGRRPRQVATSSFPLFLLLDAPAGTLYVASPFAHTIQAVAVR